MRYIRSIYLKLQTTTRQCRKMRAHLCIICCCVERMERIGVRELGFHCPYLALIGAHIGLAGGTIVLRVASTVRAVQAQGAGPAAADGKGRGGEGDNESYKDHCHLDPLTRNSTRAVQSDASLWSPWARYEWSPVACNSGKSHCSGWDQL